MRARFEDMRKQRLDEFMAGFSVITSKLKEMYQVGGAYWLDHTHSGWAMCRKGTRPGNASDDKHCAKSDNRIADSPARSACVIVSVAVLKRLPDVMTNATAGEEVYTIQPIAPV